MYQEFSKQAPYRRVVVQGAAIEHKDAVLFAVHGAQDFQHNFANDGVCVFLRLRER